jgi:carboxypeptidase Taq
MPSDEQKLQKLKSLLAEIDDINSALSVLAWDQATYMPGRGASARGRQMATLGRLATEKLVSPEIGELLDDLNAYEESLPYESDEAGLIRVTRRDYEQMTKVPPEFIGRLMSHSTAAYQVWAEARPENNFSKVRPLLEETLELSRELANYFPGYEHIADPLIDNSDYGMTVSSIRPLFADLRSQLVPLVQSITEQPVADDSCLRQHFPEADQIAFSTEIVKKFGFDFDRGRLDKTHHPFETKFSINDVRITTRVDQNYFGELLFSTLHESGHGMYELGVDQKFENTPLANGTSAGVHESQSRLWENLIGRSKVFWNVYFPKLQQSFPVQFGNVDLDTFYRAINKVEPSLIRVDADEVTYNLHVMLRFDLELDLLEGKLAVQDLPDAWRSRFKSDIGIEPPDDKDGVLQDVHWFAGTIGGAFQGYTIGNVLSALFFEAALNDQPDIKDDLRKGNFGRLHGWLVDNIYQHGRKFTAQELVKRVTGDEMSIDPYIGYLRSKYSALYQL